MVTTKVHATGSFIYHYSLQSCFWRSDLLTGASLSTVLRNTSMIQNTNSQEDLVQWSCVLPQGIFFHVQKALLHFKRWHIQRRYTAAPYITRASLSFSRELKIWGYGVGKTCSSLFHDTPLKIIPAHRNHSKVNSCVSPWCGTMDNSKPFGEISQLSLHERCRKKTTHQKLTAKTQ